MGNQITFIEKYAIYILKCATKFTLEIDFYFCLKRARLSIQGLGAI